MNSNKIKNERKKEKKEILRIVKDWVKNYPSYDEKNILISGRIITANELLQIIQSDNKESTEIVKEINRLIKLHGIKNTEKITKATIKSRILKVFFTFHRKIDDTPNPWHPIVYFSFCVPFLFTIDSKNPYIIFAGALYMTIFLLSRMYYRDTIPKLKQKIKNRKKTTLKIVK